MPSAPETDSAAAPVDDGATVFRAFERGEFLEWPAWTRLRRILGANGGSYGLSGPRGAGKSWLMLRAIDELGEGDGRRPGIGLWYPSPSEYDPHAFIASLSDSFAAEIERWYAANRGAQRREARYRAAIVTLAVTVATLVVATPVAGFDSSALLSSPELIPVLIIVVPLIVGLVLTPLLTWRSRWPQRRLLLQARVASRRARYSTTQRETSEFGGEGGRGGVVARARRVREREFVERPATLSSLVNDFRALASETGRVIGGVVIAIDELDKMSDPEGVRALLRDIKAIFEVPRVHFLVSVSDEAARNLSLGSLTTRNEFNSSFYTVLQAQPARPEDCAELLHRRGNVPREVSLVLAVLAGGNPREVVRLAELAGQAATGSEAVMLAIAEEALALRREIVTAEPIGGVALGQAAREAAFLALSDDAFEHQQEFAALCASALTPEMWDPQWADSGWTSRFSESWRRLMVRLAVAGELAGSSSIVRDTDLTDRLLDVITAAGQSGQVAKIVLDRKLRIESRRSTPDTPGESEVRAQLEAVARDYDSTRAGMPSGSKRTSAMDTIASNARRLARDAHLTTDEIRAMLRSKRAGDRVVGLATVQATADPATFRDVLAIVRQPATPFEQYHALRALESLRPGLPAVARSEVATLLGDAEWRSALRGDSSRSKLADRILKGLTYEGDAPSA